MLQEKLERINELRKQAMSDPEFMKSAQAHADAIKHEYHPTPSKRSKKPKTLSDIYQGYDFGI
ncbi:MULTISPECIES: hypothetical protein [Vibrio]|jgi:hypothetical protein|uniref:Uncharacterized protein n=1 Tax=Vibrio mediterranei TaxID=689 RepID=A0A2S9ZH06_9VIBR|nr:MULTISPECIES: hypothetical protein [Vibrio]AYV22784.1 hypothetical protein ECB94_16670 [Vibrio mediterranei]EDL54372.1 hypothetical protein VSAK1_25105 [Vibrio mediterranei AK1]KFA97085.1 hypothetical protein HW45_17530 [Vibrio sp. ER1A]MCF4176489.1 hypothetical protein [Vibrio sp. McD22-P3]MCG9628370.1 hypothetical protein [Vibrio mediterranei]